MTFLAISFIAGVLTVLAPCILPLLPVVVGSSVSGRSKATPYIVVGSLALSIILFTFVLKVSTAFIAIPPAFWSYVSGAILAIFGLTLMFPTLWNMVPGIHKLSASSNKALGAGHQKKSFWGDVTVGAALGPVFSTCSPTYFVILASVLPASFALGTAYLLAYVIGLSLILLLIAVLGERFVGKLVKFSDPNSSFKRWLGVLFVVLGLIIMLGIEKKIEAAILDSGFFDVTKIENSLLQKLEEDEQPADLEAQYEAAPYIEITNPSGFVNTEGEPVSIGQYVGEKVILIDFMAYSCINCQRTFPYLNAWHDTYADDGLVVIGIHTPEFAFERDQGNVEDAMQRFGIEFPVVLDNEYGTWKAYGNRFWPRKYLIDIHGNVVYDHIGEGAYEETEMKIQELLRERSAVLGEMQAEFNEVASEALPDNRTPGRSPETYLGSARNKLLANGTAGVSGIQNFVTPDSFERDNYYLGGTWNVLTQSSESVSDATVTYRYYGKEVFIVAESAAEGVIEVWQNGEPVDVQAGADVSNGQARINDSRLYKLIMNEEAGEYLLELKIKSPGVKIFTFTFG